MSLEEYINERTKDGKRTRSQVVNDLVERSGCSRSTIYNLLRGLKIRGYAKALSLSKATGNKVKVGEIAA